MSYSPLTSSSDTLCKKCGSPTMSKNEKDMENLGSRIRHLQYASEDYDRLKGKGSFRKDNKVAAEVLDKLLKDKVNLAAQHACITDDHEAQESSEFEKKEMSGLPVM